jgi:hypothetical protein
VKAGAELVDLVVLFVVGGLGFFQHRVQACWRLVVLLL